MYPMVVMIVAAVIVSVILIFIVPKFEDIFTGLGAELPWLTQQLVTAGEILKNQFALVILGLFVLFAIFKENSNVSPTRSGGLPAAQPACLRWR